MKKRKAIGMSGLVAKLDRIFSRFIRMRNADSCGTVECVTCGKLAHYSEVDAGHYVKRQHMSLRFHPINVQCQCKKCNRFMGGVQDEFGSWIIKTYGVDVLESLMKEKHKAKKYSRYELEEMITDYTAKVKALENGAYEL
jgi:hypothetical protein